MLRFPPKCPRSHSPTTFPPIWSFLLCFLPVTIFIYFLAPPHHFSSVFGLRTVIPPILLPAPRPERHLCICTHEAGAQGEAAPGAGEHGNAQVVSTHGGGCTWGPAHSFWQPIWAWEPAQSPAHLFSLSCLVILCWSCLSPVGQSRPTMSRMSSPLRSGKEITANVLCTYFSVDANSFQDSIWMNTKGPSSL